jgi:hypothetical protein
MFSFSMQEEDILEHIDVKSRGGDYHNFGYHVK